MRRLKRATLQEVEQLAKLLEYLSKKGEITDAQHRTFDNVLLNVDRLLFMVADLESETLAFNKRFSKALLLLEEAEKPNDKKILIL